MSPHCNLVRRRRKLLAIDFAPNCRNRSFFDENGLFIIVFRELVIDDIEHILRILANLFFFLIYLLLQFICCNKTALLTGSVTVKSEILVVPLLHASLSNFCGVRWTCKINLSQIRQETLKANRFLSD